MNSAPLPALAPCRKAAMPWSIQLSKGKKGQIIQQLMAIKASIKPHRLDAKQYFPISSSMRYEAVID
jgi:hypothetical protein